MLRIIKNTKFKKYGNIDSIYDIVRLENDHIIIDTKNKRKVIIYEIIPVNILEKNIDIRTKVITKYIQFLRNIDMRFQILIRNEQIEIQNYYDIDLQNIVVNEKTKLIYKEYIEDMIKILREEQIYISKYYLIVSLNMKNETNILQVDECIYLLEQTGCIVRKMECIKQIKKFLYGCINKVRGGEFFNERNTT
ncbi:MAG: hypothetical protein N2749_06145 [Clostridia bacterium]|nr:hypothetical protein [Clostridia bacterium]